MKQTIYTLALLLIAFGCKDKAAESQNQDEAEVTPQTETEMNKDTEIRNEGWIVLFDGTNLDQWRGYLSEEMHPEWTIEGDAMAFTPGEQGGKNIITRDKYTNFELSLEWKISEGGNSGIFWGVFEDEKYPEAYQTGPEIQVLDNQGHPDAKAGNGTHTAGSLYDMIAPKEDVTKPAGEWNHCVIEINHATNYGKVTLNDVLLFSFGVHGDKWDHMVANSKFADWEGFGQYHEGHIGLQDHSDKVWYRNIKVRVLD